MCHGIITFVSQDDEDSFLLKTNLALASTESATKAVDLIKIEGHHILFRSDMGGQIWVTFDNLDSASPEPLRIISLHRKYISYPLMDTLVDQKGNLILYQKDKI